MSIGEALGQARRHAGLSVADVSRRTRIRETLISDIERDDYSRCGADFYARGHIRAIARAVGTDSRPLIEEYDAAHPPAGMLPGDSQQPAEGTPLPSDTPPPGHGPPPGHVDGLYRDGPYWAVRGGRRRVNWTAVLALALVAVVGFGAYLLAAAGHPAREASSARGNQASAHPSPSASHATPSPTRTAPPVRPLNPVNIAAFGPTGTGQGDNPQLAPSALDDNAASPWHSDWYATAQFGNVQPGTGLLLDMGHTVTVASAQIAVGNSSGADVELRVGGTPALAGLPAVARGTSAGRTMRLQPTAPTRGRYVLVWFTQLPLDQSGTFQASVYSIKLQGQG